jgi:hypothetical protein
MKLAEVREHSEEFGACGGLAYILSIIASPFPDFLSLKEQSLGV